MQPDGRRPSGARPDRPAQSRGSIVDEVRRMAGDVPQLLGRSNGATRRRGLDPRGTVSRFMLQTGQRRAERGIRTFFELLEDGTLLRGLRDVVGLGPVAPVPGVSLDDELEEVDHNLLHGVARSAGRCTGRAHVVSDPAAAAGAGAGEVLVCRAADPGWVSAFDQIGALVTEVGSASAYGTRVCRMRGLPSVQLAGATAAIPHGALLVVDGTLGTVRLADAT